MLTLDDSRWSTLSHAYGSAKNVPDLLLQLAGSTEPRPGNESEPWFSLWSCLCHQGAVFDASYAALPHIVEIACVATGPTDFSFFQLPAAIEVARSRGSGPAIPPDLVEAYAAGIAKLTKCVSLHSNDPWDDDALISALCALAVAKGHPRVAEAIMNLDDDLIQRLIDLDFDT